MGVYVGMRVFARKHVRTCLWFVQCVCTTKPRVRPSCAYNKDGVPGAKFIKPPNACTRGANPSVLAGIPRNLF